MPDWRPFEHDRDIPDTPEFDRARLIRGLQSYVSQRQLSADWSAVEKAPMAPAVPRKANSRPIAATPPATPSPPQPMARGSMAPEVAEALAKLAEAQVRALRDSKWVGDAFAEQTRAMHYGERDPETIHGQASPEDAQALFEEGIPVAPLPFPVAPPDELK